MEVLAMILNLAALLTALVLDGLIGDPEKLPHIVVYMGKLISFLDSNLNIKNEESSLKKLKGLITVLVVILAFSLPSFIVMYYSPIPVAFLFSTIIFWYCIALKTLKKEALLTGAALKVSLNSGRLQVSRIVGRQTTGLNETEVISAAIETVAENTSDGVIAPLFYGVVFGPIGALVYRAINTMDSMIGYKNEKYEDFGYAAAKIDDLMNLIPSRITGLLAILLSPFIGGSINQTFKVFIEDRYKHESPNSAQCESAFAGALRIRLNGPATYDGIVLDKPYINESGRKPEIEDIDSAVELLNYIVVAFMSMALIIVLGVTFL